MNVRWYNTSTGETKVYEYTFEQHARDAVANIFRALHMAGWKIRTLTRGRSWEATIGVGRVSCTVIYWLEPAR